MAWTAFAALGRLLCPMIGAVVPAVSPRLTMALITLLLAVLAIGAPAGAVWLSMRGVVIAERQARDLHWQTEITKANQAHGQKLEAARAAADAVSGTPADRAERLRVCQASPSCRDRGR